MGLAGWSIGGGNTVGGDGSMTERSGAVMDGDGMAGFTKRSFGRRGCGMDILGLRIW